MENIYISHQFKHFIIIIFCHSGLILIIVSVLIRFLPRGRSWPDSYGHGFHHFSPFLTITRILHPSFFTHQIKYFMLYQFQT